MYFLIASLFVAVLAYLCLIFKSAYFFPQMGKRLLNGMNLLDRNHFIKISMSNKYTNPKYAACIKSRGVTKFLLESGLPTNTQVFKQSRKKIITFCPTTGGLFFLCLEKNLLHIYIWNFGTAATGDCNLGKEILG